MAATKSQGKAFTLFLAGLTVATAGIAFFTSGSGKVALVVGLIGLASSFSYFLKLRPLEGRTAEGAQPAIMKLAGVVLALVGWLVVLFGLHLTASVSGRMITTLVGLAITLIGVIGILPVASSKSAIWKA